MAEICEAFTDPATMSHFEMFQKWRGASVYVGSGINTLTLEGSAQSLSR